MYAGEGRGGLRKGDRKQLYVGATVAAVGVAVGKRNAA